MEISPLDAVITGTAFEDATTAIGVLEQGQGGQGKISTEMLCTLDNFIQTILFHERVFLTISPWFDKGKIIPGGVQYRGGIEGRKQIDGAGIFSPLPPKFANPDGLRNLVDEIVKPGGTAEIRLVRHPMQHPKTRLAIYQEMASMDAYFMEDAIAQAGVEKFKPVFPGEHLYLGLRGRRTPMPRVTQTISDLVKNRLRTAIREKMAKLNVFVSQGAPLIPEAPPIYVSRILKDCETGADFIPVLLIIRNSPAFRQLREWMAKCSERSLSPDPAERAKAAAAWQKFTEFPLDKMVDKVEVGVGVLNAAVNIVKGEGTWESSATSRRPS